MKFKENIFKKYKDNLLNYGFDYLRLVWKGENLKVDFNEILKMLDTDNSNFYIDDNKLTWTKLRTTNWDALIVSGSFLGFSVPIFQVVVFDDDKVNLFKSKWKIDFYGSFFRLSEMWFIDYYDFILNLFWDNILNLLVSRVDYKRDFKGLTVEKLSKLIVVRKNARVDKIEKWKLLTFAVGSKSSKRVYLRIYDKIEDILYKGKSYFYSDYLKYKDDWVVRLEFEFLNHFCRNSVFWRLVELENKIWSYVGFNSEYINKKYIYFEEPENVEVDKLYSVRNFVWRWRKLVEIWENPFELLFNYLLKFYKRDKIIDLLYDLYGKL